MQDILPKIQNSIDWFMEEIFTYIIKFFGILLTISAIVFFTIKLIIFLVNYTF